MNDYDKAFAMICSRVIDRLGERPNNVIKSFIVDLNDNIRALFNDGFLFVRDDTRRNVLINDWDLSQEDILKTIIKHAKEHDIYLGKCSKIKIVAKGETLENLAVEYDMKIL